MTDSEGNEIHAGDELVNGKGLCVDVVSVSLDRCILKLSNNLFDMGLSMMVKTQWVKKL